jgi:mgtE-like transporter
MTVRDAAWSAYREALPALVASLVGGLIAGLVLSGMRAELRGVPGLLVLVPALLATRGNVYGSLGARISTALHQGLIEPRVRAGDERLRAAVAAALANGLLASSFAAVAAVAILTVLGDPVAPLPVLLAIAVLSGLLSGVTLAGVVVTAVFAGYRRGHDPDTLVGPLVTTTGDVFGMAFLLVAARVVLSLVGVV